MAKYRVWRAHGLYSLDSPMIEATSKANAAVSYVEAGERIVSCVKLGVKSEDEPLYGEYDIYDVYKSVLCAENGTNLYMAEYLRRGNKYSTIGHGIFYGYPPSPISAPIPEEEESFWSWALGLLRRYCFWGRGK